MAAAAKLVQGEELDLERRSSTSRHFEDPLRHCAVGQNEAGQALVDLYLVFCSGLDSPGRPMGNLLFLKPTGSGKTRTVEAAADILFLDSRAVIQGGSRRISALARNRQVDWFVARVSGTPRNTPAHHLRGSCGKSSRSIETEFPAVRSNRESERRAVAVAVRDTR